MNCITFNSQDVELPDLDWEAVRQWLCRVAEGYGKRIDTVNYLFVSDEEILRVNRQFIGHDYYTDHIGFDYTQGDILSGDTYISLDTVHTNAQLFHKTYDNELLRVIVHSILHLCGLNDKTPSERAIMEQAEDKALAHKNIPIHIICCKRQRGWGDICHITKSIKQNKSPHQKKYSHDRHDH